MPSSYYGKKSKTFFWKFSSKAGFLSNIRDANSGFSNISEEYERPGTSITRLQIVPPSPIVVESFLLHREPTPS